MLAYAANRPLPGKRQSSPNALLLIVSAHVALLAAVMSAKMEMTPKAPPAPPLISVPLQTPPPPPNHPHPKQPQPRNQWIDRVQSQLPIPRPDPTPIDARGTTIDPGPIVGGGIGETPQPPRPIQIAPLRHDPRLLTPLSELKPPYPASKLASEEEAMLKLRLTIDEHGRVVSVDPVGFADREFLEAARRYMIAHWRYEPATEDGRPITSTTVVSLRFRLDG